jgi:mannose-6-phosphate isomerase-like protein (cupin superfamily)
MRILELSGQGETLAFPDTKSCPTDAAASVTLRLAPGALGPEPHIHLKQDEFFTVRSGRLVVIVDGTEHVLEVGDTARVPRGAVHTFRNGHADQSLEAAGRVEPVLHLEWMLHEMASAAIRHGGRWKDLPLLLAAYVLHEMRDEYRLAGIPMVIQRPLFWLLHRLARLTGRHREIASRDEYYRHCGAG